MGELRFKRLKTNVNQQQTVGLILHTGETAISEKSGKPYPKRSDYFLADGVYKTQFEAIYHKANRLNIWFPSPDLRKIAQVFKEYRNEGGVPVAKITTDWTKLGDEQPPQDFEINQPGIGWMPVTENIFDKHVEKLKLTGRDTLRLFFMIQEFMKIEPSFFCLCQIETRGAESSIPGMLNMLSMFASAGKLQVPFQLVLEKVEGKGLKKDGTGNEKRIYPVLLLMPDTSEQAQIDMGQVVNRFLKLNVAPAILEQYRLPGKAEQPAIPQTITPPDMTETWDTEEPLEEAPPETIEGTFTEVQTPGEEAPPKGIQPPLPETAADPNPLPEMIDVPVGYNLVTLRRLVNAIPDLALRATTLQELLANQKNLPVLYALWNKLNQPEPPQAA